MLRCFRFDQNTRTMSVVVRDLATGGLAVFTKVNSHTFLSSLTFSLSRTLTLLPLLMGSPLILTFDTKGAPEQIRLLCKSHNFSKD
jgi:magnesium-transporting ATPase (P-type)